MALPDFTTQDATSYKTNIDATATDHDSRIGSAEGTVSNHETRITQNESDISGHDTRITQNESDISGHETRITQNESDIASHDNYLSGATAGTALTTGDEGSGGGIDADTVDGKELTEINSLASASYPAYDAAAMSSTSTSVQSVGPSGSGADITWSSLDNVPASAKYIEVRTIISSGDSTGANSRTGVYAYKTGASAATTLGATLIGWAGIYVVGASSDIRSFGSTTARIPVDSNNRFNIYKVVFGDHSSVELHLCGWGF